MTVTDKFTMAGIDQAHIAMNDSEGWPCGLAGTLAAGSAAGMIKMEGLKTNDLNWGESRIVDVTGDNHSLGAFVFPPGQAPRGTIEGAIVDMNIAAAVNDVNVVTEGAYNMMVMGGRESTPQNACAIFQGNAESKTGVLRGQGVWWGWIIPKMTAAWMGTTQMAEAAAIQAKLMIAVRETATYPWGKAFTLAVEKVTGGTAILFVGPAPRTIHSFRGNGALATVTLDETPVGDHTAAEQVIFAYNKTTGVQIAPTTGFTVVPSTRILTFLAGSIPASGDRVCIYYGYVA